MFFLPLRSIKPPECLPLNLSSCYIAHPSGVSMLLSLHTDDLDTFSSKALGPAAFILFKIPHPHPTPTPGAIGLLLQGGYIQEAGLSFDSPIQLLLLGEAWSWKQSMATNGILKMQEKSLPVPWNPD